MLDSQGFYVTCAPGQVSSRRALPHGADALSSTQVCLVGSSRTYPPAAEAAVDEQRTQYVLSRRGCPGGPPVEGPAPAPSGVVAGNADHCPSGHSDGHSALDAEAGGRWLPGFHPREKVERVRNCAALPREFIDHVVLQVADLLLGGKQSSRSCHSGSLKTWNRGGNCPHWPGCCWVSGSGSISWGWSFFVKYLLEAAITNRLLTARAYVPGVPADRVGRLPGGAEGRVVTLSP